MYELYIVDPWAGSSSHFFDTLREVLRELETWGFKFLWSYEQGREVLHATFYSDGQTRGVIAQVFKDDKEITASLCPRVNLSVLY